MQQQRHRPSVALEKGHRPLLLIGGERGRLTRAVQVRPGRLRPVQYCERRVPEDVSQVLLQVGGSADAAQLDHEATCGRMRAL